MLREPELPLLGPTGRSDEFGSQLAAAFGIFLVSPSVQSLRLLRDRRDLRFLVLHRHRAPLRLALRHGRCPGVAAVREEPVQPHRRRPRLPAAHHEARQGRDGGGPRVPAAVLRKGPEAGVLLLLGFCFLVLCFSLRHCILRECLILQPNFLLPTYRFFFKFHFTGRVAVMLLPVPLHLVRGIVAGCGCLAAVGGQDGVGSVRGVSVLKRRHVKLVELEGWSVLFLFLPSIFFFLPSFWVCDRVFCDVRFRKRGWRAVADAGPLTFELLHHVLESVEGLRARVSALQGSFPRNSSAVCARPPILEPLCRCPPLNHGRPCLVLHRHRAPLRLALRHGRCPGVAAVREEPVQPHRRRPRLPAAHHEARQGRDGGGPRVPAAVLRKGPEAGVLLLGCHVLLSPSVQSLWLLRDRRDLRFLVLHRHRAPLRLALRHGRCPGVAAVREEPVQPHRRRPRLPAAHHEVRNAGICVLLFLLLFLSLILPF